MKKYTPLDYIFYPYKKPAFLKSKIADKNFIKLLVFDRDLKMQSLKKSEINRNKIELF